MRRTAEIIAAIGLCLLTFDVLAAEKPTYEAKQLSPTWTQFTYVSADAPTTKFGDIEAPTILAYPTSYGFGAIIEAENAVWLATERRGLWRYRSGAWEDLSSHVGSSNVRTILKSTDGTLWFTYESDLGGEAGIARYKDGSWQRFDISESVRGQYSVSLKQIHQARDGTFWFPNGGRLFYFRDGKWGVDPAIKKPRSLLAASDGSIWVTCETDEPVWRSIGGGPFEHVSGGNGVSFRYPNGVFETPDGTIWIGDYGLTAYSKGKYRRVEAKPTLDDDRLWPAFVSREGTLYVHLSLQGLYAVRDDKFVAAGEKDWQFDPPVLETHSGELWYATGGEGVARIANGKAVRFSELSPEVSRNVVSLHEAADGSIWAAVDPPGIARFANGSWSTVFRNPIGRRKELDDVVTWCNAADGSLWIGFKNGDLRRFTPSNGALDVVRDDAAIKLTLHVTSGRTNPADWHARYGFSSAPDTPPNELFSVQFAANGETLLAVPPSNGPLYLHASAVDADGTVISATSRTAGASEPVPISSGDSLELPGLRLPASKTTFTIDGVNKEGDIDVRGDHVVGKSAAFGLLSDGVHIIEVAGAKFVAYKEKVMFRLFKPFERSVAVIVAVSNYPPASEYPTLPAAETQAKQLELLLAQQGFETRHLYGPNATKANIERLLLEDLNLGPKDRLLVYFGGHGASIDGANGSSIGYVVPYDGKRARLATTAIALSNLMGDYSKVIKAKHIFFVLDSCQSGLALTRGSIPEDLKKKAYQDIVFYSSSPGRMLLAAGTKGEAALDVSGGIFTRAFLNGIRGDADADHNGVIDFYELAFYVRSHVAKEAVSNNFSQHPEPFVDGDGRFIFITDKSLTQ